MDKKLLDALDEYQAWTNSTAIYDKSKELEYLTTNIGNEIWECVNAPNRDAAIAEMGDIVWYISQLANLTNTSLSVLIQTDDGWPLPMGGELVALPAITGELLEMFGPLAKHYRDGTDYYVPLTTFILRAVRSIWAMCDIMNDVDMIELLQANRTKLESRKRRGKLGGSGDKR